MDCQIQEDGNRARLRVVGAGLGRTGTMSLKIALERLLGAPCYHMTEVFSHPEHVPAWHAAARGQMPDWQGLLAGYGAAVDWPAAAFWPELSAAFPDAIVLLSLRDPQSRYESATQTIFRDIPQGFASDAAMISDWLAMVGEVFAVRFTSAIHDPQAAIAAYDQHNAQVQATVPAHRLVRWRAADGWEPLCAALGVPVPDEPFPRTNTREEWRGKNSVS